MSDIINEGAPASNENSAPSPTEGETPAVESEESISEGETVETEGEADDSAEAAEKKKEEKAAAARRRKFQLKVDGREEELEIDLENEEELKKHLQLSKAAQKRMQEKAEYEKKVRQFLEQLTNDPISVLKNPNILGDERLKEIAKQIINEEVEEMKKTPEQKEKEALQKRLKELEEEREREKKDREEAEFRRLQEQAAVQYDRDITTALDSVGLPKTPYSVHKMAQAMMLAMENGIELQPHEVAPMVRDQMLRDFRDMVGLLPEDKIEDYLGKEILGKIRKRTISRIKQPAAPKVVQTGADVKKPEKTEEEKISAKDFFKKLGKF